MARRSKTRSVLAKTPTTESKIAIAISTTSKRLKGEIFMKYVTLNTGAKMPMLGLGVYRMEGETGGKEAILAAFEAGYRSIDTAAAYDNELLVGEAIRESGLKREELFVTTKLSNPAQRAGNVQGEFAESLEKLGLDYVDLYLMHWPVPEHYRESWAVMESFFKSGRAKAIGVSNFQGYHIEEIKQNWSVVPAVNQVELHPRLTQKPLLEVCQAEGIAPQSWSPLGGGKDFDSKGILIADETLTKIGKKYDKSAAQVILRWNIEKQIIAIPKSAKPERIKSNIDIFDFALTPQEIAEIDNLNVNQRTGPDPDNFAHLF